MGDKDAPAVGGGVDVADYSRSLPRLPRRVICNSSPDRCAAAAAIGRAFDFVHTYKPVPGYRTVELPRDQLIEAQLTAQVLIYPYDPTRESDFFSMAVLEAMAAGTPVVMADGASHVELWADAAIVLPRPIRLAQWHMQVEDLLSNKDLWQRYSDLGRLKASEYTWDKQAARYLQYAMEA